LTIPEYEQRLRKFRAWSTKNNNNAYAKIEEIPRERWIRAYDGGRRYGHMTTNLVECVNGVYKKTRHLPITSLVQATYYKLATSFARRKGRATKAINKRHPFSQDCTKQMQAGEAKSRGLNVEIFSHVDIRGAVSDVEENKKGRKFAVNYAVSLPNRWCDCGKFQADRFPCAHVIAICNAKHIDYHQYVDKLYRNETLLSAYSVEFKELPHESYWPDAPDYKLVPEPKRRRGSKGRPQSRRIHNEMDEMEKGPPKLCQNCWQPGHDSRTCAGGEHSYPHNVYRHGV
jgi:SWIM zinc finger